MATEAQTDFWSLLGAFIISTISGVISITQRIVLGQRATLIWVISEFLAAILCGYLMYDLYSNIQHQLPQWATMPVMIAVASHVGGRSFQAAEKALYRRFQFIPRRFPPPNE